MELSINPNQSFKSRAYPIKSFVVSTPNGKLTISEAGRRDFRKRKFTEKLAKMLCRNYASLTNDPSWLKFNNPAFSDECNRYIRRYSRDLQKRIKMNDENTTLLLVKDKKNKLQGACFAYGFNDVPGAQDNVCYIEALAVNKPYRGFNIGRILVEKVLDSAKNRFTDTFLAGELLAKGFYKKLGFKPLSENNYDQKTVIDYISRQRCDYPKYVDFLTKPLQEDKPRWYENSAKEIDKEDAKYLAEMLKTLV